MTNWTDHAWVIREEPPDRGRDPIIRKENALNSFRLVAMPDEKNVVYYIVEDEEGMTEHWKTAKFFPRGAVASPVWNSGKLPRLPKDRKEWPNSDWTKSRDKLKSLQQESPFNLRRLEGDFLVDPDAHAITLWIVEEAIDGKEKGPQPLLLIDRNGGGSHESGTGTGDPK